MAPSRLPDVWRRLKRVMRQAVGRTGARKACFAGWGWILISVLLVAIVPRIALAGFRGFPEVFTHEAHRYPDLTQTDLRASFPLGGWFHCGPVAASNALIWFRDRGISFGASFSGGDSSFADQLEIAGILGSEQYMDTRFVHRGTTVSAFLLGLEKFLRDYGDSPFVIAYMGWGDAPKRFTGGGRVPDLTRLCRSFSRGGAVLLNLGWYVADDGGRNYRRNGGHWVTMVGYRWPGEQYLPEIWVHDPAPWSGKVPRTHRVKLEPAGRGVFFTRSGEALGSMWPYVRVAGGLAFKRDTELALVEGAVILFPDVEPAVPWRAD